MSDCVWVPVITSTILCRSFATSINEVLAFLRRNQWGSESDTSSETSSDGETESSRRSYKGVDGPSAKLGGSSKLECRSYENGEVWSYFETISPYCRVPLVDKVRSYILAPISKTLKCSWHNWSWLWNFTFSHSLLFSLSRSALTLQSSFVNIPDRRAFARFSKRESFALIAKLRTFAEQLSVGSMVSHLSNTNWAYSSRFGCLLPHVSSFVEAVAGRRRYTITTFLLAKVNTPVVAICSWGLTFWIRVGRRFVEVTLWQGCVPHANNASFRATEAHSIWACLLQVERSCLVTERRQTSRASGASEGSDWSSEAKRCASSRLLFFHESRYSKPSLREWAVSLLCIYHDKVYTSRQRRRLSCKVHALAFWFSFSFFLHLKPKKYKKNRKNLRKMIALHSSFD